MDNKRRAQLRKEAQSLDASVQIGKDGLTPGIVAEVVRQLEDRDLIKVRMLRSTGAQGSGADDLAKELAESARAELVEVRGHTAVLARRGSRRNATDRRA